MMTVLILILFFLLVLYAWTIAFTLHRKLDDIQEQLEDIRSTLNKDDFGIEQIEMTNQ
jgi:cell division protein FtsL